MTQITTTTQPGDVVVIVPGRIISAVGFLGVFSGLAASFLIFVAGYILEGAVLAVLTMDGVASGDKGHSLEPVLFVLIMRISMQS